MLLNPNKRAIAEIRAYLRFTNNHHIKNNVTMISRKGKPRPRKEISHHFCGFTYGAMHESRKKKTAITFARMRNRFVNSLNLLAM